MQWKVCKDADKDANTWGKYTPWMYVGESVACSSNSKAFDVLLIIEIVSLDIEMVQNLLDVYNIMC